MAGAGKTLIPALLRKCCDRLELRSPGLGYLAAHQCELATVLISKYPDHNTVIWKNWTKRPVSIRFRQETQEML